MAPIRREGQAREQTMHTALPFYRFPTRATVLDVTKQRQLLGGAGGI